MLLNKQKNKKKHKKLCTGSLLLPIFNKARKKPDSQLGYPAFSYYYKKAVAKKRL